MAETLRAAVAVVLLLLAGAAFATSGDWAMAAICWLLAMLAVSLESARRS